MRLAEKYGEQRLENASKRASTGHRVNYGILLNILQNNMDKIEIPIDNPQSESQKIPSHDNLRGPLYYTQSTMHFNN